MNRRATAKRGWVRDAIAIMGALACLAGPAGARDAAAAGPAAYGPVALASQVGRLMFFDPSLSASGKLACGTCHDPRYAYGPPPGKAIALGGKDLQQPGTRAVPSLRYLHGAPQFREQYKFLDGDVGPVGGLTWDGRAESLAVQARIPLFAANEMANANEWEVVRKLRSAAYAPLFRQAFGERVFEDPARAFAAGMSALQAFQQEPAEFFPYSSRYDAFLKGDIELTDQEERGAAIFKDPAKGNCASCHLGTSRDGQPPPFTDFDFVNVGAPRNPRLAANQDPSHFDVGLCGRDDLKDKRELCGFFRSPTLRNVALRDTFFHNGVFTSLRQVIEFYNERDLYPEKYYSKNPDGSVHRYDDLPEGTPENIDHDPPLDRKPGSPRALSAADIDDLITFLKTLTDKDASP